MPNRRSTSIPRQPMLFPIDLQAEATEIFALPEPIDFEDLRAKPRNQNLCNGRAMPLNGCNVLLEQSISELKGYEELFDKTRDWKSLIDNEQLGTSQLRSSETNNG